LGDVEPRAQHLFDPPKADGSPSAFACTAETLASGQRCTFEAQPPTAAPDPSLSAKNVERAKALAVGVCKKAVSATSLAYQPGFDKVCRATFEQAARECGLDVPLLDGDGRFAEPASRCYRALADARQAVGTMVAAAPGCCACLAANRCAPSIDACVNGVQQASAVNFACAGDACSSSCTELQAMYPGAGPGHTKTHSPKGLDQ
jgi:hypothetical protein